MLARARALADMQIVSDMAGKVGLALPLCGAIKEMMKEARRVMANPPDWTDTPGMAHEAKG